MNIENMELWEGTRIFTFCRSDAELEGHSSEMSLISSSASHVKVGCSALSATF